MHIYAYIRVYKYTYIHTYTHTHIHIYTHIHSFFLSTPSPGPSARRHGPAPGLHFGKPRAAAEGPPHGGARKGPPLPYGDEVGPRLVTTKLNIEATT